MVRIACIRATLLRSSSTSTGTSPARALTVRSGRCPARRKTAPGTPVHGALQPRISQHLARTLPLLRRRARSTTRPSTRTRSHAPTTSAPAPPAPTPPDRSSARPGASRPAATRRRGASDDAQPTPRAPADWHETWPPDPPTPSQQPTPPSAPAPPAPATPSQPTTPDPPAVTRHHSASPSPPTHHPESTVTCQLGPPPRPLHPPTRS